MSGQGSGGNVIAALCNIPFPGLGQLVQGRFLRGLLFFVSIAVLHATGPFLLFIGNAVAFILHIWAIIDAAKFTPSWNHIGD